MSDIRYRPEIDGLRAVAILSVLLFHAGFENFRGGFVGVDIFFVISGFLITTLIVKDLDAGNFNIWDFWKRRFCRLLPAMAVMTAIVLPLCAFVYFPEHLKSIGQQVAWQSVFASNFYFHHFTGYFNPTHYLKPFLHTWSLAVEEQFYLVYPLLMAALYSVWQRHIKLFLVLTAVISFAACVWMTQYSTDSAFYLLPFRAWELLIGAFIALCPVKNTNFPKWVSESIAVIGAGLIYYSVFYYIPATPFPGSFAALPCIGAAAIIWSNTGRLNYCGRILSLRVPVFIGLISYSLYLWHWPLMAISHYLPFPVGNIFVKCALVLASFWLGYLSWRYVETPFRLKGKDMSISMVYRVAFATLFVIGLSGAVAFIYAKTRPTGEGFANLAAVENDRGPYLEKCNHKDQKLIIKDEICQTNERKGIAPDFILWGDSHAAAETSLFYDLSKAHNKNGYVAYKFGCPPIIGFHTEKDGGNKDCFNFNNEILNFIDRHKIKKVYLNSYFDRWTSGKERLYFEGADYDTNFKYQNSTLDAMQSTFEQLRQRNVKIIVLLSPPAMDVEVPRMLALQQRFNLGHEKSFISLDHYLQGRSPELANFMQNNRDVIFLDPAPHFCPNGKCWALKDKLAIYYDKDHLSQYGATLLTPLYAPLFK